MQIRPCHRVLSVVIAVLLSGCAVAPLSPATGSLLNDALFAPPAEQISAAQVFALSPAMQRYADTELRPAMSLGNAEQVLVDALYSRGQLQLEYDAAGTRTAAEAFEARTGNCLSLVIMTASFARYLGLPVRFQDVQVKQSWSRNNRIVMASGHINLSLSPGGNDYGTSNPSMPAVTIDFLPSAQAERLHTRGISEQTVIGMYFNNRAAEALAVGDLDAAYAWAKAAITESPKFLESYNTLGVIYHQSGHAAEAEGVLREVLARTPQNTVALSNLVGVLQTLGRRDEAARVAAELARIEPYPPFHFYDRGLAALKAGDASAARHLFQRELKRERLLPEANFGLAMALLRLGETTKAERHLKLAIDNSTTLDTRSLYSAKLDWLHEQGYGGRGRESRRAGS